MDDKMEGLRMGLDTMDTDAALDAMMKILPDVARILNDAEAGEIIGKLKGESIKDVESGDAFRSIIPLFAGKYKAEFLRIVAVCQGCTVDEVRKQNLTKTTSVFAASLRMLISFFGCCLHMARSM